MFRFLEIRFVSELRSITRESLRLGKFCLGFLALALALPIQAYAQLGQVESVVDYTAPNSFHGAGTTFTVPITFDDHGFGVLSFQFDILFDPAVISPTGTNFGCSTAGTIPGSVGTSVVCNYDPLDPGRLRLTSLGFAPFTTGPDGSGPGPLVNLTFTAEPTALPGEFSPLTFTSDFFFDSSGPFDIQNPTNGQITIVGPTAANVLVSGRALRPDGQGIGRAILTIEDVEGNQGATRTNPFGHYMFSVEVGGTYVIRIFSKGHTFKQSVRVISVSDSVTGIDFVSIE